MYLIALQKGGYQAIPIKSEDKWDFRKLLVGRREVRIILRVRGETISALPYPGAAPKISRPQTRAFGPPMRRDHRRHIGAHLK